MEDRIDKEAELLAWIEGDLNPEEAERVRARLAGDPELSRLLHEMRADRALLRQVGEVEAPEDLLADAQNQLERTLLLDSAEERLGAAATTGATGRRVWRLGAWGSLAAVLLIAVTLGVTWRLGVFTTPQSPPASPTGRDGSRYAQRDADDTSEVESFASPLDRAVSAEAERRGSSAAELGQRTALAEDVDAGRESTEAPIAAAEPEAAPSDMPGDARDAIDGEVRARVLAAADAGPAAEPVAPPKPAVLVWQKNIAMDVALPVLEEPQFQQNLRLVVSSDPQEYIFRNSQQTLAGRAAGQEWRDESFFGAAGQNDGDAAPEVILRTQRLAEAPGASVTQIVVAEEPADDVPLRRAAPGRGGRASPTEAKAERGAPQAPSTDAGDERYGQIWLQMPGGELNELWVPMEELPQVVEALNTPTQVAWLEFDPQRQPRFEAARQRLLRAPSLFWWRHWDELRTRTIYTVEVQQASDRATEADDADEQPPSPVIR